MKTLSSAGVTLAILAAAGIGVVTTWMLMRPPQPVVVVFAEAPGESRRASRVAPPTAVSAPKESKPRQSNTITPSNSFPRAAAPSANSDHLEPPAERPSAPPAPVIFPPRNAPVLQQTTQLVINDRVSPGMPQSSTVTGSEIEDALSFALEAAEPYVKEGFTVREDYWGGDLPVKAPKAIVHQLFRGNEYWFWVGTGVKEAKISVHIYDSEGNLAELEAWAKPHRAAARVVPKKTSSYYLIVEVEKSDRARTPWAMSYGFR